MKRAAKLGLRMQGRKKWTAEEDEVIKTYYKAEGGKSGREIRGKNTERLSVQSKVFKRQIRQ